MFGNSPLGLALGGLRKRKFVPDAPVLRTYNYDPSWADNVTLPEQDENGWSIFTPSIDSRIMYVSDSEGDDTAANLNDAGVYTGADFSVIDYRNPGTVTAFKTVAAALAKARSGYPDYVLCKKGDVFAITSLLNFKRGRSEADRSLISFYGSGMMPVFEHRSTQNITLRGWYGDCSFAAIQGIRFTVPERDPDHPDFVGFDNIDTDPTAISYYTAGAGEQVGMFIEGVTAGFYNTGVIFGSGTKGVTSFKRAVMRRVLIHDTYKGLGGGHPQGLGGGSVSGLFDEIYLVGCGHYEVTGTSSPATEFSHSIYFNGISEVVLKNIVSSNPSSMHVKLTSNPPVTYDGTPSKESYFTLTTALTGASETAINVSAEIRSTTPQTGQWYVTTDLGTEIDVNDTSWSGNTFTIEPTDFSSDIASIGSLFSSRTNLIETDYVSVIDSVFIDGEIAVGVGGNADQPDDTNPRFNEIRLQGNLLEKIGYTDYRNSGVDWGFEIIDNKNTIVSENLMTNGGQYLAYLYGSNENVSIFNNVGVNQSGNNFAGADVYSNLINPNSSVFINEFVGIEDYSFSLGGEATIRGFEDLLRSQTMDNYDDRLTAKKIQEFFRKAYVVSDTGIVITQVADLNVLDGNTGHFDFDIFANSRIVSFQWYDASNDSAIEGEASNSYFVTAKSSNNGLQVYCVATDSTGKTYRSATGTLTLSETAYFYDIANEPAATGLPSFIRLATNNQTTFNTSILETTRPDGSTGNVWQIKSVTDNSNAALILKDIAKNALDKEVCVLMKGVSGPYYTIHNPAPRVDEEVLSNVQYISAGIRAESSEVRLFKSNNSATPSALASSATGPNVTAFQASWWWVRVKATASGMYYVKAWQYGAAEPGTWNVTYDGTTGNSFAESYCGLAGWNNRATLQIAAIGVGLDDTAAPISQP
jgi:hypothetical protein